MKNILFILLLIAGFLACTKNRNSSSSTLLKGKWIDAQHTGDTLEIYGEGGKLVAFDNTFYLRTSMLPYINYNEHRREIGDLLKDEIYVRPYQSSGPFFNYYFKWVNYPDKFETDVHAIRPYISSVYNVTWIKVI